MAGRPSLYSEVKLIMAKEYLTGEYWKTEGDVIPTIEGLALFLSVSRDTIYEWSSQGSTANEDGSENEKAEFSDTIAQLQAKQGRIIMNKGLTGDFNSVVSKLILSAKHDYKEKSETDLTTKGESLGVVVLPAKN